MVGGGGVGNFTPRARKHCALGLVTAYMLTELRR
jgi:hypothetical protein